MKCNLVAVGSEKTYVVVFDKGDEVLDGLQRLAEQENLSGAHFSAIGALSDVVLGYFDGEEQDYLRISVREQVEVLVLTGNIALKDGSPKVHAHIVVGRRDGSACGGHLLEGHVWPTLEVVLQESPKHLCRRIDDETGLALIDLPGTPPAPGI